MSRFGNIEKEERSGEVFGRFGRRRTPPEQDTTFLQRAQQDLSGLLASIPQIPAGLAELGRQQVEFGKEDDRGFFDLTPGPIAQQLFITPAENTLRRIANPSEFVRDFSEAPVSTLLEDVGNILPVARLGKGAGLGKAAAKTVNLKRAEQLTSATLPRTSKFIRETRFVREQKKQMKSKFQKFQQIRGNSERNFQQARRGVGTDELSRSLARLSDEEKVAFTAHVEGRAATSAPKVARLVAEYELREANQTQRLVRRGILSQEQADARRWQPVTNATGRSVEQLKELGVQPPMYIQHLFEDATTSEFLLQQPLRKTTPGFLKKSAGAEGFIEDPSVYIPRRTLAAAKNRITEDLVDKVQSDFGKAIPDSGELLPGFAEFDSTGLAWLTKSKRGTFQLPDAIAKEMKALMGTPSKGEKLIRQTLDPATNLFRISVLALSPRWIFNNTVGNFALNNAALVGPKAYWDALQVMRKGGTAIPKEVKTGLFTREFHSSVRGATGHNMSLEKVKKIALAVPNKSFQLNSGIESFFRTANFLSARSKGLSKTKAIKQVNEFLFDYTAMTNFERAWMRRVFPFWNWTKNITRLTATFPIKHPTRTAVMGRLTDVLGEASRDGDLPPFMVGQIATGLTDEEGQQLMLSTRGLNPFGDVGSPLEDGGKGILRGLNPVIKVGIERGTGTNTFTSRDFTSPVPKFDEQGREIRPVPSLSRQLLSNSPQFKLAEDIAKPFSRFDTGEPLLDKFGKPLFKRSPALTILKQFGINLSPDSQERIQKRRTESARTRQRSQARFDAKLSRFERQRLGADTNKSFSSFRSRER